jgi:hypothetical protein
MDRPAELKDARMGALKILREEIKMVDCGGAHPYRTIGIAAGVGCVLGSRLGRAIVTLASSAIGRELGAAILTAVSHRRQPIPWVSRVPG